MSMSRIAQAKLSVIDDDEIKNVFSLIYLTIYRFSELTVYIGAWPKFWTNEIIKSLTKYVTKGRKNGQYIIEQKLHLNININSIQP